MIEFLLRNIQTSKLYWIANEIYLNQHYFNFDELFRYKITKIRLKLVVLRVKLFDYT